MEERLLRFITSNMSTREVKTWNVTSCKAKLTSSTSTLSELPVNNIQKYFNLLEKSSWFYQLWLHTHFIHLHVKCHEALADGCKCEPFINNPNQQTNLWSETCGLTPGKGQTEHFSWSRKAGEWKQGLAVDLDIYIIRFIFQHWQILVLLTQFNSLATWLEFSIANVDITWRYVLFCSYPSLLPVEWVIKSIYCNYKRSQICDKLATVAMSRDQVCCWLITFILSLALVNKRRLSLSRIRAWEWFAQCCSPLSWVRTLTEWWKQFRDHVTALYSLISTNVIIWVQISGHAMFFSTGFSELLMWKRYIKKNKKAKCRKNT